MIQKKFTVSHFFSCLILFVLVVMTFFPFVMLINMSLKQNLYIKLDFLGWPAPKDINWENYAAAWEFVKAPIWNSLFVCAVSLVLILLMVAMCGYAFGRFEFRGKGFLFAMLLAVMMIPYTMLLIPNYSIIRHFGLLNTYWALIIPYVAGDQIFGVLLARTFFETLPAEMFEAARIDGAGELQTFMRIALPLSVPTMITVGINCVILMYNDYIWPTLVLTTGDQMKTFCQIVFNNAAGNGTTDYGMITAAFVIGTLPLLVITLSCLKYYLQGMLEGAVKG